MSDNDLIRRGDVRKLAEWFETEDGEVLAVDMDDVDDIPAVPQEMSAREYLNARWLMCLMYDNCKGCPFCESWEDFSEKPILCYSHERMDSDGAVAVVEKWAREHPETDMMTAKYALPKIDFEEGAKNEDRIY